MTLLHVVMEIRVGVRLGLALLALSGGYAWFCAPRSKNQIDRYRSVTGGLFALGIFAFALVYLPGLFGYPPPILCGLLLEIGASMVTCAALICLVATRAMIRGISTTRVHRGMAMNCGVVVAFVGWSLWVHG